MSAATFNPNIPLITCSRLAMIISDILVQLYGDNMAANNSMGVFETLRSAFDLSWKLSEWRSSVPAEIRPGSVIAAPEIPRALQMQRFQTGLSLYFHAAQALIYRPVLLRFLQYKPDGTNATETLSLLKDSGFSTIKKCMHTCSRGVALAKMIVDEQFRPTSLWGAWWMTNFLGMWPNSIRLARPRDPSNQFAQSSTLL